MEKFIICTLLALLLALSTPSLQAQIYVECATNLFGGDDSDSDVFNGEAQVLNGSTYLVWNMEEGTNNLLGASPQPHSGGGQDIYVSIVDENCVQTVGTYSGGFGDEIAEALIINDDGSFFIAGTTGSPNFPTTDGSAPAFFSRTPFIQKYAADGTLLYSTVLEGIASEILPIIGGGSPSTQGAGLMEIISDGSNAYLFFETTDNAATIAGFTTDGTDGGGGFASVVVVKLDATGSIVYASSVGGSDSEDMLAATGTGRDGLITELNGCLYVQAATQSTDFPTTDGTTNDQYANYLLKYDPTGNLVFSTIVFSGTSSSSFNRTGAAQTITDGTCVYTLGRFRDRNEAIVSKHDAAGNLIYQQIIPGIDALSNLIYQNGALYIGAYTRNDPDFPATIGVPATGSMAVIKLDAATGNTIYASVLPGGSSNTNITVGANGEVYAQSAFSNGAVTTDGSSSGTWYFAKLDVDGNLSSATLFNTTVGDSYPLLRQMDIENNILTAVGSPRENIPVTDNSPSDAGNTNYWIVRLDFCPDPPTITNDVLTPATQMACSNGVLDQILGEEFAYDGTQYPDLFVNGTPGAQADLELSYQWQSSATGGDPWTDVIGPVGQQQSYTPPPSTQDIYYRRLTFENPCCSDGTPLSTSTTVFIDIGDDFAPEPDAGGQFYACPGTAITIGTPPNSATGGQTPYTYLWSDGSTVAAPMVSSAEGAIYTLSVTDDNGCMQVDQASVTIYQADAGADQSVCDGDPATLGGAALPGLNIGVPALGTSGITYTWSPTAGLDDPNIPNPAATMADTYTLTVRLYQPDGTFCETTDDVTLTVFSPPANPNFAGEDMVVCIGESTVLGTPAEVLSTVDVSSTTVTQTSTDLFSNTTATAANLTDGDFTTGGHTSDGTSENITIDLGSIQNVNTAAIAAVDGRTNDDGFILEVSTDDVTYNQVGSTSFAGASSTGLTTIRFTTAPFQYFRIRSPFSTLDVSISEVSLSNEFGYIWAPGAFLSSSNIAQPTFDAGNLELPDPNPYTYTVTANIGGCNFYDQVSVYVIEARAGDDDGCGPRLIGEGDRTPNIDETYSWRIIPELTTGDNSGFTGPTDLAVTTVSGNDAGETHYELTTTFVLNGETYTCRDTTIVPPCGPGCDVDIEVEGGGCPNFDSNSPTLTAAGLYSDGTPLVGPDFVFTWTPMEGLDTYTGNTVVLQDNVDRTYTVTVTSLSDPNFTCSEDISVNTPLFSTPIFSAAEDIVGCPGDVVSIGDPADNPNLAYEWTPTTGFTPGDEMVSNPEVTIVVAEEYAVLVTDITTGCVTRDTVLISLDPGQATAGPDLYICDNATVSIGTNTAIPGYTYSWSPAGADWRDDANASDPNQVNEAIPNVFVSTIGGNPTSQTFTLTVTSPAGCVTTDRVTVFVNPLPPTPLNLTDVTFCPSIPDVILGWTNSDGTGVNDIPSTISTADIASSMVSQSTASGGTATATNLTDGDFTTGGHTNDGTNENIVIDLGSLQTINVISIAALSGQTGDDQTIIQVSDNGFFFDIVATAPTGLSASEMTSFAIPTAQIRYIRFVPSASFRDVSISEVTASYEYGYQWAPAELLVDATVQNPTLITPLPTAPITFELTLLGGGGCNSTGTQTITPTITAPEVLVSPAVVCLNEDLMIGSDDNTTGTYTWVADAGNPAGGSLDDATSGNPTFTGTETGTYTYTVTKEEAGCTSMAEVTIDVREVEPPTAVPVTLCQGETGVIGPEPDAFLTYSWFPTTGLSDPTIAQPTFTGTASQNYTVTVFNSIGCSAEFPVSVSVSTEPVPEVSIDDIMVCFTETSEVVIESSVSPTGTYSYQWTSTNFLSSASVEDPTLTIPGVGSYTYSLLVTDQTNGCNATEEVTITASALSEPIVLSDPADQCIDGDDMTFTATPAPGGGATGVFTTTATMGLTDNGDGTATLDVDVATAGTYDVTYTYMDANGCEASQTVSVEVFDLPVVTLTDPDDQCIGAGGVDMDFNATPAPSGTATGVFSTTATAGLTDNGDGTATLDIDVAGAGTYDVTYAYMDENGCMASETVSVEIGEAPVVTVATPATICATQTIDLTVGASVTPGTLAATWSSDGDGTFDGSTAFGTATTYTPGAADGVRGEVTLTLTTDDPDGPCEPVSASVTFTILNVDCGTFPWGGN